MIQGPGSLGYDFGNLPRAQAVSSSSEIFILVLWLIVKENITGSESFWTLPHPLVYGHLNSAGHKSRVLLNVLHLRIASDYGRRDSLSFSSGSYFHISECKALSEMGEGEGGESVQTMRNPECFQRRRINKGGSSFYFSFKRILLKAFTEQHAYSRSSCRGDPVMLWLRAGAWQEALANRPCVPSLGWWVVCHLWVAQSSHGQAS